jgi:hypothetical protein
MCNNNAIKCKWNSGFIVRETYLMSFKFKMISKP